MTYLLYSILALYVLWPFYLAVMCLKGARDAGRLSKYARAMAWPILIIGAALDAFANIVIMSVILLELPREWLVTPRLKRHIRGGGYRRRIAVWMGEHLLDPFDPSGSHL